MLTITLVLNLARAASEDCVTVIQENCAVKKSPDDELLSNLSWLLEEVAPR